MPSQICRLFSICLLLLSAICWAVPLPLKGYQVTGEFLCNGLPLIGTTQTLEDVNNCAELVLHLDIRDRETTMELLEPFQRWNASFQIACVQSAAQFNEATKGKSPTIIVIHNCSPQQPAANSNSSTELATVQNGPQQEQICKKWTIAVPEEDIVAIGGDGADDNDRMDLGTLELSGLGETVECPSSVALSQEEEEDGQQGEEDEPPVEDDENGGENGGEEAEEEATTPRAMDE